MFKNLDISNTIDENNKINYIKLILYVCIYPKYISNITNILLTLSFIFNIDKLIHAFFPLCLSNGIIITVALLFIKNINLSSNTIIFKDDEHKKQITELLTTHKVLIYSFVVLIHFIIPFIIYYTKKYKERKKHSMFLESFFIIMFSISIYTYNFDIETYSPFGINGDNLFYVLPIYILLNLIISYVYFI
jgi:hypothetical protein